MYQAILAGSGVWTPAETITNAELVASFNRYVNEWNAANAAAIADGSLSALQPSSEEFILKASGIAQRFVMEKQGILDVSRMMPRIEPRPNEEISIQAEMAVAAARMALDEANAQPGDIDGVLVACSAHQRAYPAMAVEVQHALGIDGFGFDMNVACSSATFALKTAQDMVASGGARAVLVVNPEFCSPQLNYRDRDSHFIFGDVATAFIVARDGHIQGQHPFAILSTRLKTVFSNNIRSNFGFLNRVTVDNLGDTGKPKDENLFNQEGRKVFKEVCPMVAEMILAHLESQSLTPDDITRYWLHQANQNMNDLIIRKILGRDPHAGEAPIVLNRYANTASAGSIIAFHGHKADLKPGDKGVLCSFGAGYSVGVVTLEKIA